MSKKGIVTQLDSRDAHFGIITEQRIINKLPRFFEYYFDPTQCGNPSIGTEVTFSRDEEFSAYVAENVEVVRGQFKKVAGC